MARLVSSFKNFVEPYRRLALRLHGSRPQFAAKWPWMLPKESLVRLRHAFVSTAHV